MQKYDSTTKDLYTVRGTYENGKWFLCKLRVDTPEEGEFTDDIQEAYDVRNDIARHFPEIVYTVRHIAV